MSDKEEIAIIIINFLEGLIIALPLFILIFVMEDSSKLAEEYNRTHEPVEIKAEIIDKYHVSEFNSSISGVILGTSHIFSGGGYTPEKWVIVYRELESGNVKSKKVNANFYYDNNIGDKIVVGTRMVEKKDKKGD